ncbi:MAG: hypothetical protein MI685_10335 [Chlorobiales bacterium]|nr:hypothetical protein [Chlorobiales bacterium]
MATYDTGWVAAASGSSVALPWTDDSNPWLPYGYAHWSNPGNILSDDENFATCNPSGGGYPRSLIESHFLVAGFDSFNIPSYATNITLAVRVRRKYSTVASSVPVAFGTPVFGPPFSYGYGEYLGWWPGVFLYDSTGDGGFVARGRMGVPWTKSEEIELLGSESEDWSESYGPGYSPADDISGVSGPALSATILNSGNFEVRLFASIASPYPEDVVTFMIDQVEVRVWYDAVEETVDLTADGNITLSGDVSMEMVVDMEVDGAITVSGSVETMEDWLAEGSISLSGDVTLTYYDGVTDVDLSLDGDITVSGYVGFGYLRTEFPIKLWHNESGLVAGEVRFFFDEAVSRGGCNADNFFLLFELCETDEMVFETGAENEYVESENIVFFPSELTLRFAVLSNVHNELAGAHQYWRDAVKEIEIARLDTPETVIFKGKIDRLSVEYDSLNRIVTATFLPFINPDRSIKNNENTPDYALLNEIFDDSSGWTVENTAYLDAKEWFKVRYIFERILRYFFTGSVTFGNFNRLFTAVITKTTDGNETASADGWNQDGSMNLQEYLGSVGSNNLFDKILVSKHQLYGVVGSLKDMLENLSRWFFASVGIDQAGNGYVVPTYTHLYAVTIADENILSVRKTGYLPRSPGVVGVGVYDDEPVFFNAVFGNVRYDDQSWVLEEGVQYYYKESGIFKSVEGDEEEVLPVHFPIKPENNKISSSVADGFGYSDGGNEKTHTGDLLAITQVGSEEGYRYSGYYYIYGDPSYIREVTEKHYEYRSVDREVLEIEVSLVDLEMHKVYKLESGSQYGSGYLLRPLRIQSNYTTGRTIMEAINVTRV